MAGEFIKGIIDAAKKSASDAKKKVEAAPVVKKARAEATAAEQAAVEQAPKQVVPENTKIEVARGKDVVREKGSDKPLPSFMRVDKDKSDEDDVDEIGRKEELHKIESGLAPLVEQDGSVKYVEAEMPQIGRKAADAVREEGIGKLIDLPGEVIASLGVSEDDDDPYRYTLYEDVKNDTETQDAYRAYFDKQGGYTENNDNGFDFFARMANSATAGVIDGGDSRIGAFNIGTRQQDDERQQHNMGNVARDFDNAVTAFREQGIDDGAMTYDNLTSNYMTRDQYIAYAKLTGTGRPIEELEKEDPAKVFSKSDEMKNYGFKPFIPDDEAAMKLNRESVARGPSNLANHFARLREDNVDDYKIKYNGNTYNGREFMNGLDAYNEKAIDQYNNINLRSEKEKGTVAYEPSGFDITLEDGTEQHIDSGEFVFLEQPVEGRPFTVLFTDSNEIFEFEDMDDLQSNLRYSDYWKPARNESRNQVMWGNPIDDYILPDGTAVPFDDVRNISMEEDVEYDFGPLNWNRPLSKMDMFDLTQLAPNVADLTLMSAPYFDKRTSFPLGASNAELATHGIDPQTLADDGTAYLLNDDIDNEQYLSSIIANGLMPLTEIGFGAIGKRLPIPGMNRLQGNSMFPMIDWATGVLGEGVEEIPGNVVEEIAQHGISGFYGNPVLDENGDPVVDDSGHIVVDTNTSMGDRFSNFVQDIPEALAGGITLGASLGIPGLVKSASQVKNNLSNAKVNQEIDIDEAIKYLNR